MKVSLSWLKEWVDIPWKTSDTASKLTDLGFPVEGITVTGIKQDSIVTAKILSVEKHPQADRLQIAKVSDGKGERQIVCGAKNIAPEQVVPLALPGTKFSQEFEIKVSKIRGVESHGMLCSERELGISDDHEGIMQLAPSTKLGQTLKKVLGPGDTIFDIDVTPNRPDTLSHVGMARELSALSGKKLKTKPYKRKGKKSKTACKIQIKEAKLCHRYMGKIFHDVKIGPSPDWMVKRLTQCGIRSINNVVDITNYVLLEFGHPLHAFDLAKLKGPEIIVRKANNGEKMMALDDVEYKLNANDLVIADQGSAVAIAGIMGGQETGVTESTTDILLESAVFDRTTVRTTSKRLALKSESSIRFEKGTDAVTAQLASDRAAHLIEELAGGKPGDAKDAYPKKTTTKKVKIRSKRVAQLLGVAVPDAKIQKILSGLGFKVKKGKGFFECEVPAHRKDIFEEVDLIEEVIRVIGYNTVPNTISPLKPALVPDEQAYQSYGDLKERLKATGINETISSSFSNADFLTKFGATKDFLMELANPLSQEESVLRPSITPNLIKAAIHNINHQQGSVRLFEIGKIFFKANGPAEMQVLSVLLYGNVREKDWRGKEEPVDYFRLKGVFESINGAFQNKLTLQFAEAKPFLHPHQSFLVHFQGQCIGMGGMIHPNLAQELDLTGPCGVLEINLSALRIKKKPALFSSLPKYPFVERDVAIIVGKEVVWQKLEQVIRQNGGDLLKDVVPFDIFSGGSIDVNKKSVAFRVKLQHEDHTLSDAEINTAMGKIRTALKQTCGADLR